jgi:hypothetical protein
MRAIFKYQFAQKESSGETETVCQFTRLIEDADAEQRKLSAKQIQVS